MESKWDALENSWWCSQSRLEELPPSSLWIGRVSKANGTLRFEVISGEQNFTLSLGHISIAMLLDFQQYLCLWHVKFNDTAPEDDKRRYYRNIAFIDHLRSYTLKQTIISDEINPPLMRWVVRLVHDESNSMTHRQLNHQALETMYSKYKIEMDLQKGKSHEIVPSPRY
jgi:hypothetical protein